MTLTYPFDLSSEYELVTSITEKVIDKIDCNYSAPVKDIVLSMLIKVRIL
jgi:hypothetical protein